MNDEQFRTVVELLARIGEKVDELGEGQEALRTQLASLPKPPDVSSLEVGIDRLLEIHRPRAVR